MADDNLAVYLNDHMAGAVAAVELLEHLEKAHAGTPIARFVGELRADVEEDKEVLAGIIARLGHDQSGTRKAAAWLTERIARLKLRIDDPSGGALRLFESLEAMALGVDGKRALWPALDAISATRPQLQGIDFAGLERRADEQRRRIEAVRIDAARAALGEPR